jgi:hypothetical protein
MRSDNCPFYFQCERPCYENGIDGRCFLESDGEPFYDEDGYGDRAWALDQDIGDR